MKTTKIFFLCASLALPTTAFSQNALQNECGISDQSNQGFTSSRTLVITDKMRDQMEIALPGITTLLDHHPSKGEAFPGWNGFGGSEDKELETKRNPSECIPRRVIPLS